MVAPHTSLAVGRFSFAIAIAVALAACYAPTAPFEVPCSESAACPSGQMCDPEDLVCRPPTEARSWRDDTAEDFAAAGADTGEVTVEAAGFVGPIAYFSGGVRLTGIDRHAIGDPLTPWNEVAAAERSGASLVRGIDLDFGSGTPLGLGLSGGNDITVLVEGELQLDVAGAWRFELTANDLGFLEIAPPGSAAFVRVVTDENDTSTGTYEVTAPGWHRIRGAFADGSGAMAYEVRYDRPGPGNFRAIPAAALRAPAGDLGGVLVDGFDEAFMLGPSGSVVHAGTLGGLTLREDPFGLPVGIQGFTLRFAAQVRIDAAGPYALRIDSSQGHRAWLGGAQIANAFTTAPQVTVTAPVELEPGWHDLVIDMHKEGGGSSGRLDVTIASGPAWVGEPIPADHLRPLEGRGARWAAAASTSTLSVPDLGTATRALTLEVPAGLAPTRIDAAFEIDHPLLSTVGVQIDPPAGATTAVVAAGDLSGGGVHYQRTLASPANAGDTWGFLVSDTVEDVMIGELLYAAVTMTGPGGPAPFPASYRYVSAPRDLGVVSFSHVRWALRQARPDTLARVSLRTCDDAAACAAEPWTEVEDGARPGVPPRRFAQYQIELSSDGDVPTALDWIEIGYRAYQDR